MTLRPMRSVSPPSLQLWVITLMSYSIPVQWASMMTFTSEPYSDGSSLENTLYPLSGASQLAPYVFNDPNVSFAVTRTVAQVLW